MRAASQLPGKGPTDVDDAPAPARKSKIRLWYDINKKISFSMNTLNESPDLPIYLFRAKVELFANKFMVFLSLCARQIKDLS